MERRANVRLVRRRGVRLSAGDDGARHDVCPTCKGEAYVDKHGGLKKKPCPRCGGRGWLPPRR